MKSTSSSSERKRPETVKHSVKVSSLTEEQRVLAFLKKQGFRPMTKAEKKHLAAIDCLGIPEE
ncbi:MAG: hypothetical protein ACP5I4_12270 [Oceanipulchritudo sp.]